MGLIEMDTNAKSILQNILVVQNDESLEVMLGFQKEQKTLSPKYFYDQRGSLLFDQICELDAYYLTRTETGILQDHIQEIADLIGPDATIIEYGSGSSVKTEL